jgi:hypothetical protein
MDEKELNNLLGEFNKKLSKTASGNTISENELLNQKSKPVLKNIFMHRLTELIIGVIVNGFLGEFLYNNWNSPALAVSAGIIMLFTVVGIAGCVRQLLLIRKFDYSTDISQSQSLFASLQFYIITYFRLAVLQLPLYMTYVIVGFKIIFDINIWEKGDHAWLISQIIFSVLLVPVTWWIIKNVTYKNIEVKWIRKLLKLTLGYSVISAMEYYNEIENFKKG